MSIDFEEMTDESSSSLTRCTKSCTGCSLTPCLILNCV